MFFTRHDTKTLFPRPRGLTHVHMTGAWPPSNETLPLLQWQRNLPLNVLRNNRRTLLLLWFTSTRTQPEYDFVEQPSQDFFCPVTFELLTEPHLIICCRIHFSQDAVNRLLRDSRPCPMCSHPQLTTVLDKNMPRRVSTLKVRCQYKENGCELVGEISDHLKSCPKRPWSCSYCQFQSTYDIQACTKLRTIPYNVSKFLWSWISALMWTRCTSEGVPPFASDM